MTNLPATFEEADAYQFARNWIDEQRAWGFHPNAERVHGKQWMKHVLQFGPFWADEIVALAQLGNVQADLALREAIAEKTDRNEPLGAVLGAYNIRLLNPRPKSGRPPAVNAFVRDCTIVLLVHELQTVFPGLKVYRNRASNRATASTIAADALKRARIVAMDHKTVEKLYDRYWKFRERFWPERMSYETLP